MNFPHASNSFKSLNPYLFGRGFQDREIVKPSPKRLRQSSKPLLNKLESEYLERLKLTWPNGIIRAQAKRYMLANGLWYKPDFTALLPGSSGETAWEVKGPHAWRGGFENLKMAAHEWPEVQFILAWKQDGEWVSQEILP